MTSPRDEKLLADLAELKLHRIAEDVPRGARRGGPQRQLDAGGAGLADRRRSRLPPSAGSRATDSQRPAAQAKTLQEYDFNFPKRIPKQAILRLFDCDFVAQHGCAVFIGPRERGSRIS